MIIYIHGFGGSGEGQKSRAFREYFKNSDEKFIAPSLSYIPDLAIKTLEALIESYDEEIGLIGSSLGGFYALYLAERYNLKAVLINPSIHPYVTLQKCIGDAASFYDTSSFTWTLSHIEMLKKYVTTAKNEQNFMLLLQKGDEHLDYKEAVNKLQNAMHVIEEGGNHSFEAIERYFQSVREFLR